MKKKGLIIATIVMVLVLAVSLTTATYAWFTVSDVTTIEAFDVKVVPNNAVNIGLKSTYKPYVASGEGKTTVDDFVYGDVTYTPGQAGVLGGGWAGQPGVGATLTHNIVWGSQKKAVGVTAEEAAAATLANTKTFKDYSSTVKNIVAANGDSLALQNQAAAVANYNAANTDNGNASDYVHMVLGVQPTKALTTNELVILLDGAKSEGTIVGILAAVHVAYRINGGEWQDKEFFSCTYDKLLAEQTLDMGDRGTSYVNSYKSSNPTITAPTSKAGMVVIDLSTYANDNADLAEVEIIIYIAGADTDCNNSALNASGALSIFFHTV